MTAEHGTWVACCARAIQVKIVVSVILTQLAAAAAAAAAAATKPVPGTRGKGQAQLDLLGLKNRSIDCINIELDAEEIAEIDENADGVRKRKRTTEIDICENTHRAHEDRHPCLRRRPRLTHRRRLAPG